MPVKSVALRPGVRERRSRTGGASPHPDIAEMQRARLLSATVLVVEELGWSGASVAHITARARVSRRTFYDLFDGREDCLFALVQDVVRRIEGELAAANLDALPWRERVRGGLLAILSFFDREPVLARVCVVGALQGGPRVLRRREQVIAQLAAVIDEGRSQSPRARDCASLTAEGLVGAALAIVYARLVTGESREQLTSLLGELMSLIVLPYLGPAAARSEQGRPLPARELGAGERVGRAPSELVEHDPLREVPMRLTYRTALVLEQVAQNPGASNRVLGEQAEIHDQGQISKLLARLQRLGLTLNTGVGHTRGEPNAWRLTPLGERVTRQLSLSTPLREDIA